MDLEQRIHDEISEIIVDRVLGLPHRDFFIAASAAAGKTKMNKEQFDILAKLHDVDSVELDAFFSVFQQRRRELFDYLTILQPLSISKCYLSEFDYSVRMNFASSLICEQQKPYVVLKLHLKQSDASIREVLLEMDKHHVKKILEDFSKIKQALVQHT